MIEKLAAIASIAVMCGFQAQAQVESSVDFEPAQVGRSHMDIGGTWSGAGDVSSEGDRFSLSISNTSTTDPAYDLSFTAALPAGFIENTQTLNTTMVGTGDCGTAPLISVSRSGDDLIFDTTDYDLPVDCELNLGFGVIAPSGTLAGTYTVSITTEASSTEGEIPDLASSDTVSFLVLAGAIILEKTPSVATAKVGDTVSWTLTARNSGLGGIFDANLDESGLGSGLALDGLTPTAPITPAPNVSSSNVSLPYLAPGESFSVTVDASVAQCEGLTNTVAFSERTALLGDTAEATIQLELETPSISYAISSVDVPFGGSGSITLDISNSGAGDAQNFGFETNLAAAPLSVVSVSAGWDYDPATGRISRTAGPLTSGANESVVLTIADNGDVCSVADSAILSFKATFEDDCATAFSTPAALTNITFDQAPDISLMSSAAPRLSINQSGTYTLTVSAGEAASLDDDPVTVTHTLPQAIQDGALLTPSSGSVTCSGTCGAGDTISWDVPRADLTSAQTLTVGITTSADPCDAGLSYSAPASVNSSFATGVCPVSDGASAGFLLSTYPQVEATQIFNQSGSPFETGAPDDGNGVREEGEGEEGQFSASYAFDGTDPGTWTGSVYTDDFGGLADVALTGGSLQYRLNGGTWTGVPGAAVSGGTGSFAIALDYLAGVDTDNSVAGDMVEFRYQLTAPDSALGGGASRSVEQFATLTVNSGAASSDSCPGAGNVFYSQGDRVRWQRAVGDVGISLNDEIAEVCEVLNASVSISNEANEFPIRNVLASLDLGTAYELVTPSNPTYSGGLSGGASVTYDASGPSFTLNDEALATGGNATVQVRRRATASGPGGAIGVSLDYDDNETAPLGARVFQSTASDSPFLVNTAALDIFVAPVSLPSTTDTVSWAITIRNVESGTAYNTEVSDIVPAGLTIDAADISAMDAVNAYPAVLNGNTITWSPGDIPPGGVVHLTVVASVDGTTCSIPSGANLVEASWGCGGVRAQTAVNTRPDITFPSGKLEIIHDTTGAFATLCGAGQVVIMARNIGTAEIQDVIVTEALNTALTGISLVPGSVEYSVNDGASWTAVSGISAASTLTFDQTAIPALALLSANGQSGDEVLIRFGVTTTALTNDNSSVTVSGAGALHCGAAVSSPGSAFELPVDKPRLQVTKTGRNVTRGSANGEQVYAAPGDTVEWTVTATNNGEIATNELRLRDLLAGSNGAATISGPGINQTVTADYVAITEIPAGGSATYTITEILGSTCVTAPNTADVTWGCVAQPAGAASELSSPSDNEDTAQLVMIPVSSDIDIQQTVTDAAGTGALTTNGRVTLQITNNSAPFTEAVITNTLPTGFRYDPAFTPIVTTTDTGVDGYDAVSIDVSDVAEPVVTLTRGGGAGYLRHGESLTVEFAIYQDTGLDTTSDDEIREETPADADPAVPADSANTVALSYESGCGVAGSKTDALSVAPKTPDLDVDISDPISRIVAGIGATETYSIVVTNNGETAGDHASLEITLGTGWSGIAPSGCSGTIPGTLTCDLSGGSALGSGASRTFDFDLAVANETGDLGVSALVTGNILDASNADTGGDYSLDAIAARTLGFRQTLSLQSTSEADFDAVGDVQIGEEAVLRIESVWFGGGSAAIADPVIALDFERLTGFARIDEAVVTGPPIAAQTNFGAGDPTAIVYEFADFTGGETVTIDVTVRALNDAANTSGADFDFVSSTSSVFDTIPFDSSTAGFPAATGRTETLVFERPALTVTKEVRNLTLSGTFAETAEGDAADVFEYRIVLQNTGTAPAFDLSIIDAVPNGFTIRDFSTDGLDNDGDGASDEASEGTVAGQVITFNRSTTDEDKLAELGASETLTLLYQTTANASVNPSQSAVNSADYLFDTLDGDSGSQTAPTGSNNQTNGAFEDGGIVTATVTITAVELTKTLTLTSVDGDTSTSVLVGEQADFELSIVLPAGTVTDFEIEDQLPVGLALVARTAPVYGTGVSCPTTSVTPATLPASGTPLSAIWDFGACSVADVAEADRTVTIAYKAQVENASAVTDGDDLVNAAEYNHSQLIDPIAALPVTLTVSEPQLNLTLASSPSNNIDAGDIVTLTYVLTNSGSAPAYNVDLTNLLNDNGVDDGGDGDVDTSGAYGTATRDISLLACNATTVNDTTAALGDFLFSHQDGDGDGDTTDEVADCESLYLNASTDGFAAGASITFTTTYKASGELVLETDYVLAALAKATSLPSNAPGFGDSAYERSAANDESSAGRYEASASSTLSTREVPNPQKTFTATSDLNTSPNSGDAVDVAIGETYTAELTYSFDEGITHNVQTRERVRLEGPNQPADVELIGVRIKRTSTDLTSSENPSGINAQAADAYIDVTASVTETVTGTWTTFILELGDVTHSGASGGFDDARDIESFVVEYTLRIMDTTANREALRVRDQVQIRPFDGDGISLGNQTGANRYATIVEPEFIVTKSSADSDGFLSGGEAVVYTLQATNQGSGPAYNAVLEDTLPPALRAGGLSSVSVLIDGAPPASAPVFSYAASTGIARWSFADDTLILPGERVEITYTVTADAAVAPGTLHTNAFEVAAYYSQASSQPDARRQYDRSNTASVTLGAPEIAFTPDQSASTQPGSTVIYPHILQVPDSLFGASLSFSQSSSQTLGWQAWYDADGSGSLSGGDTRWSDGASLPATGDLQFFLQAQVPVEAHDGWRDITVTTATVTQGATSLSGQVTDITTVSRLQAGELTAGKFMAIDRDCDGSLSDETPADATFEHAKGAAPGECVIYRITFRNEGTGAVTNVDVKDITPAFTLYVGGSAAYEITPPGLSPGTATTPAANDNGPVSFPYTGALAAGGEGAVTYGVKVDE